MLPSNIIDANHPVHIISTQGFNTQDILGQKYTMNTLTIPPKYASIYDTYQFRPFNTPRSPNVNAVRIEDIINEYIRVMTKTSTLSASKRHIVIKAFNHVFSKLNTSTSK